MADPSILIMAVVLTVVSVLNLHRRRRRRVDRSGRMLTRSLVWLTLAAWIIYEPSGPVLDRLTGQIAIGEPLGRAAVAVAGYYALMMLTYLRMPSDRSVPAGARWFWLAAVIVVMAVSWWLAPITSREQFSAEYTQMFWGRVYVFAFLAYLGYVMAEVTRLAWTWGRTAEGRALRHGLTMVSVGGVLGGLYVLAKASFVAAGPRLGPAWHDSGAAQWVGCVGVIVMALGVAWPSLVDRVELARKWLIARRQLLQLQPLWAAINQAAPEVVLDSRPPRIFDRLDPRDVTYRLFRRIIEIRDGQLVLRDYLDADVAADARAALSAQALPAVDLDAAVEAAVLKDGLRNRAADRRPAKVLTAVPQGGDDVASEADWLVRVTEAFVRADRS